MRAETPLLLSIVIPAHNSESTLPRAVESILGQIASGVEVVVVDDGSEVDPSVGLGRHLQGGHCRVIRQDNLGASVARNTGFRAARASLVMFVDADDEVVEGSLMKFIDAAQFSGADITISDFLLRGGAAAADEVIRAVNSVNNDFDEGAREVFQRLILARVGFGGKANIGLLGAPWAKIYRREFLVQAFGRDTLFTPGVLRGQDVLFNTAAFGKAKSVHYFPAPTYIYSVSSSSASHRITEDFIERVCTLVHALQTLLTREGWGHLAPALAKMTVTLMDEALQRQGSALTVIETRRLLQKDIFSDAIRAARLRDFSAAGRVKLVAYRAGSVPTLLLTRALAQLR